MAIYLAIFDFMNTIAQSVSRIAIIGITLYCGNMIAINPNFENNTSAGPQPSNSRFAGVQWTDPKPATNLPKDEAGKMRVRASKLVNSALFDLSPKILSVFGIWYSLTSMMQLSEKGLKDTAKKMIAPLLGSSPF